MIKTFFIGILVLIGNLSFAQANPVALWANNITVDGNAADWNPPLKHYDNETGLFFDFKNDSDHLYLCFQSRDKVNQAKIITSGMKIILSSRINGKHKSAIYFPLHSSTQGSQTEISTDPFAAPKNTHAAFLATDTMMEVKGFVNQNGIISSREISGIHAAVNWDKTNTLTYEIGIPLKELFGNGFRLKDISKDISLSAVINAMTGPDHERKANGEDTNEMGDSNGPEQMESYRMAQRTELKQRFSLSLQ